MNTVALLGRLTKDPDVRYTGDGLAIARFAVAIDRPPKDGKKAADFPAVVAFGKTAESVEKYSGKGLRVAVTGRIQTGSYERDGQKVYTTQVVADRIEFIDWANERAAKEPEFEELNEEVPF